MKSVAMVSSVLCQVEAQTAPVRTWHGRWGDEQAEQAGRDVGNGICLSSTMAEEQSQAQTLPHATQMALAATHTHTCIYRQTHRY